MGKDQYAIDIINAGYIGYVELLIQKAINLLKHEKELPIAQKSTQSQELYLLVIEQCFICMTELIHFIEQGPLLKQLTES